MRFAYLSCDFGVPVSGASGSSVHVRETVRALRRLGHEVEVFSPTLDGPCALGGCAGEVVSLLAEEKALRSSHLGREWRALLYAERVQRDLLPALAALEPEVIYERYSLFGYAGIELARDLGLALVLEVNAPLFREQARHRELVLARTAAGLEARILTAADALVVVSRALAEHARSVGVPPERITVLPNAVDSERFHPAVSENGVRRAYGLDGREVVGFVGSLKPWHDLEALLGAVEIVALTRPDVHLLVVGDGPRGGELRGCPAGRVTCAGAVPHERVPAFLAAMDVVVVPYAGGADSYFSPLKLFEAMAMARPVVGARVGQVAEGLSEGETGLLYEPGDAARLAARIREVLELPDRGAALGAAARRAVVPARTWDENARQIVAIAECVTPGVIA